MLTPAQWGTRLLNREIFSFQKLWEQPSKHETWLDKLKVTWRTKGTWVRRWDGATCHKPKTPPQDQNSTSIIHVAYRPHDEEEMSFIFEQDASPTGNSPSKYVFAHRYQLSGRGLSGGGAALTSGSQGVANLLYVLILNRCCDTSSAAYGQLSVMPNGVRDFWGNLLLQKERKDWSQLLIYIWIFCTCAREGLSDKEEEKKKTYSPTLMETRLCHIDILFSVVGRILPPLLFDPVQVLKRRMQLQLFLSSVSVVIASGMQRSRVGGRPEERSCQRHWRAHYVHWKSVSLTATHGSVE